MPSFTKRAILLVILFVTIMVPKESLAATAVAEEITPEITALARGLGDDPKRIYDYVHNKIKFVHYFGSKKGALVTLQELSGNDFDQCALLVALLNTAKANSGASYTVSYEFGLMKIPYQAMDEIDLRRWWGLDLVQTGGNWPDVKALITKVSNRSGAVYIHTTDSLLVQQGDTSSGIFARVWVKMVDGANTYYLDPSFKTSTKINRADVGTAMGYNESTLLSGVASGATKTADYARTLNYDNLKNSLNTYTDNLRTALTTGSLKNYSVDEVVGGYKINEQETTTLPTSLRFPVMVGTFTTDQSVSKNFTVQSWQYIPTDYMVKIRVQVDGIDAAYSFPELKGGKLSLEVPNGYATLYLNDQLVQTATSSAGSAASIVVSINQCFGSWNYSSSPQQFVDSSDNDAVLNHSINRTGARVLFAYGYGDPKQRLEESRMRLKRQVQSGLTASDKEVATSLLNNIGMEWVQQVAMIDNIVGNMHDVKSETRLIYGFLSYESGRIAIHVPNADRYMIWRAGVPNSVNDPTIKAFQANVFFASALEHSVIEQTQDNPSASTAKIIYLANQANDKIYRANSANWSSINSEFSGYPSDDYTRISSSISAGLGLLLPTGSTYSVGSHYSGGGWFGFDGEFFEAKLTGGNNGGAGGDYNTFGFDNDNRSEFNIDNSPTQYDDFSFDPVDMRDGAFIVEIPALSVGNNEPRGYSFTPYYNSGLRYDNLAYMAHGWTHNYHMDVTRFSDTALFLGGGSSKQMASSIVALYVAANIFKRQPDSTYQEPFLWVTTSLIAQRWTEYLPYNVYGIRMGKDVVPFVKQDTASGVSEFIPAPGVTLSMELDGTTLTVKQRHENRLVFDMYEEFRGHIYRILDQYDKEMLFDYGLGGRLNWVQDAYGRRLTFNYSGTNPQRLTDVSESDGSSSNLRRVWFGYGSTYSTDGDLVTYTDPENKVRSYVYDSEHKILQTVDPLSRIVVNNVYDSVGRVIEQKSENDNAKKWKLFYTFFENVEEDPQGGRKAFFYDERRRSVAKSDSNGKKTSYTYDGADNLVKVVLPDGATYRYEYDSFNNQTKEIDPTLEESTRTYDSDKRLKTVVDFRGKTTTYDYNAKHQVTKITRPNVNNSLANIVQFDYYTADSGTAKAGALKWQEDEDDNQVNFQYDTFGFVSKRTKPSLTLPSGSVNYETFVNNYRGDVTSHTDFRNNTTTFQYNKRRQLTQTTAPGTVVTSRTYDDAENLWKITDPKTYVTEFLYSATGKLLKTKLPQVNGVTPEIESQYDSRDWLEWTENPLDERVTFGYTAAGQTETVTDDLSRTTTTTYTDNGLRDTVTSPLVTPVQTTTYNYNDRGELTSLVDANSKTIGYEYDENGNLKKTTNRRAKDYVNTYYDDGRLATTVTPTSKTTTHAYYKRGLRHTVTEPSTQLTTYTYDAWSQLKTIQDSVTGGTAATLNYDGNGNLITHVEGTKTVTRAYDSLNRITSYSYVDTANTANNYSLGYQYDNNNNLVGIDYPDGKHVAYEYDEHNHLKSVIDWAGRETRYFYDLAGRNTEIIHHNGTRRKVDYNSAGQITDIQELDPNGVPIAYFKLNYDSGGRVYEEFIAPIPQNFTEPSRSATYDDDNRIATFNSQTVVHDNDGNMTTGPMTNSTLVTYAYDARNRLTSTTSGGGAPALSYGYDQSGNRLTVTQSSQTTRYAVNPVAKLSQVLVRTKHDGSKTFYVYGLGLLYEADEQERNLTYHYDYRGSTIALSSPAGGVMHRIEYSVYGTITQRSQGGLATDTPFLFNGRYGVQSDANGLLYMRMRYYNPYLTRFINPDPIGFEGGMNWYMYADGNPISLIDPFGLSAWGHISGGLRAIGGAFEAVAGYTFAVVSGTAAVGTSPTGVGAVGFGALALGGIAVGAHGVDQFQAGIRQMWTGQHVDSLTAGALQSAGMSPRAANLTDAGMSVVGSLGTGFGTTAIRATQLSTTSISAEVANASLVAKVGYYEVGQLSLKGDAYRYYSLWGNTLDRGAAMVADQGGSLLGWGRAMLQGSLTLGAHEGTLFKSLQTAWPTPLGVGGMGALGSTDNWLWQPFDTGKK